VPQEYLPDALKGLAFYAPSDQGTEKEIAARMRHWAELAAQARKPEATDS